MTDHMQDAGLGVPTDAERKAVSDFVDLECAESRRVDFWVNWLMFAAVIGIAGAAVFWPGR